jgi:hypothetical protein
MHRDTSGIASKGGKARAERLTSEERSVIAQKAAASRWGASRTATHVGEIKVGNMTISCAVLDDGTRVLSQAEFLEALGRHRKANVRREGSEERIPAILQGKAINPFISKDILEKSRPIRFRTPSGGWASGYRAAVLPPVCEIYLQAREAGVLPSNQQHVAKQAEILVRGLAQVGIIALVDEATGYQDARAADALAKILEAFVAKELRKWVSTFPPEYYKELFRLRGWQFPRLPQDQQKRPALVGKITNDIVYARLAPGVRQALHEATPRDERGRLKHKLFQRLTAEIGHPKLKEHLAGLVVLMRASENWEQFIAGLNRALPKYRDLPLLDLLDEKGS